MRKTNVKKKKVAKKKLSRFDPKLMAKTVCGQKTVEDWGVNQWADKRMAWAEIRYKWAPLVEQLEREKDELVQRLADIMNHHQSQKSIEEIEVKCNCGRTNRIFRIP